MRSITEIWFGMLTDPYGLDKDKTMVAWAVFRDQIAAHYGFDEKQTAQAQANYAKAVEQYDWVIAQNSADLEEYNLGRDSDQAVLRPMARRKRFVTASRAWAGNVMRSAGSGNKRAHRHYSKSIRFGRTTRTAQNTTATQEQLERFGSFALRKPRMVAMDTSVIDPLVPYFDMGVGLCLLLGLFTPVVALAAAGFLGSVFPEPVSAQRRGRHPATISLSSAWRVSFWQAPVPDDLPDSIFSCI